MRPLAAEDRKAFRDYVARTLFVTAWADWMDEYGGGSGGGELMQNAPDTPEYVFKDADHFIEQLEKKVAPLEVIFDRARGTWNSKVHGPFINELAFCLVMSSMGHGVGWTDDRGEFEGCRGLDHYEYSYFDLDDKDYPIPDSEET